MSDIEKALEHIRQTASVDNNWPDSFIIPMQTYKQALETYSKSIDNVDLDVLDELSKLDQELGCYEDEREVNK